MTVTSSSNITAAAHTAEIKKKKDKHYQNALRFLEETKFNSTDYDYLFRLSDFGNWMIENDQDIRREFLRSDLPKSYFLTSRRRMFETLVNTLIVQQKVSMHEIAPSRRNKSLSTVVYRINPT
jgi:hypothetical protein